MAVECPLCHEMLDDPRQACPSCGSKLASEALRLHERDTAPPPPDYERRASHPDSFEVAAPRGELLIEADLGEVNAPAPVIASATGIARSAEPEVPFVDPREVARVADFGPPPEHWYEAPKYAQRVRARLVALDGELRDAEKRAQAARTALEDALVTAALRGIAFMKTTMRPARNAYMKTLDGLTKRENELKAADAAVVQSIETARESLVLALEKRQPVEAIERSVRVPAKSLDPKIERTRADFRSACTDFARFVLEDRAVFGDLFDDLRAAALRLKDAADAAELRLQMQGAALDAYDHRAVALGKGVVVGAIVLGVLVVVGGLFALL